MEDAMSRSALPALQPRGLIPADLVGRLHVDLCHVAGALCRPGRMR
jgi:hypothetical protein